MTSSRAVFGIAAQAHYAAAKAGVVGLMRALALEGAAHGIAVNAIMPSAWTRLAEATFADTNQVAASEGRDWPPALVSPAVAWLAHESCDVTGEILDAGVGYVGRAFLAITPGYTDARLTPEVVRDRWEEIVREPGYRVPRNTRDVSFGERTLGSM
jgi:hypothetical protein